MKHKNSFVIFDRQDITRAGMREYIRLSFPDSEIVEVEDKKALLDALATISEMELR